MIIFGGWGESSLREAGKDSSVSFIILSHLVGPNNHQKATRQHPATDSSPFKMIKIIHLLSPLILNSGSWRCWSQSQVILGRRRGMARPSQKNKQPSAPPHTYREFGNGPHFSLRAHPPPYAAHPKGTRFLGKWSNVYFDKLVLQNNLIGSTRLLGLCKNINNTITVNINLCLSSFFTVKQLYKLWRN